MSEFSKYLLPANPIAVAIVACLLVLAVLWLVGLCRSGRRVGQASRMVESLLELGPSLHVIPGEPDRTITRYRDALAQADLDPAHPVAAHVEAIMVAGSKDARLDSSELLQLTESRVLKSDVTLRHVLGVFLICGLLGTLFGLAETLAQLSPAGGGEVRARTNLGAVLIGLRSAFAPSIWGVLLSVAGTLALAWYQKAAVRPFLDTLRSANVTNWVPQFQLTAAQHVLDTTAQNLAAAQDVARFAAEVRQDTGRLRTALKKSTELTDTFHDRIDHLGRVLDVANSSLEKHLEQMASHVSAFAEALRRWTEANETVRRTYDGLREEQARQSSYMQQVAELAERSHRGVEDLRRAHTDAMVDLTTTLQRDSDAFGRRLDTFQVTLSSLRGPFAEAAANLVNVGVGMRAMSDDLVKDWATRARDAERNGSAEVSVALRTTETLLRDVVGELKRIREERGQRWEQRWKWLSRPFRPKS